MPVVLSLVAAFALRPQDSREWLDAWQAKDVRGQSCASCHSPDGIELAGFSSEDLRRRIARHHQGTTAEKIRQLIEKRPAPASNALELRPMQPGGKVLPGVTPQARDREFLLNLYKVSPRLFAPVANLTDVEEFQRAILAIDVAELPVGIEMNRLSEDGFHGPEHASIANWLPDVPVVDPADIRKETEQYLQNPSVEMLKALDQKVVSLSKANNGFAVLSVAKYRSLLVFQHELRTGKRNAMLPDGNPFWQVAEFGRIYAETDALTIKAPAEIAEAKRMATTLRAQMKQIRLPWYWLGWIEDPSLTKSGHMGETLRADYFCRYLEEDGPYVGHEAFMLTRKLAEQNRNPIYPNQPWEIQYSFLLVNTPLTEREPKDAEAKRLFRQLMTNSLTMSLLLLEKDLVTRKKTIRAFPQQNQLKFVRQYLDDIKAPQTALIDRVAKLLQQTPEI